ncbi:lymphocyte antigen 6 family member M6 [Puntigrus tetrazona]|uniref:lymphocyte antigen 6 family member M6 n=1 Tax=Puntigrus tetrazona TaxID=1606681 RepID=UPI001C88FB18|nr:lymphocyte antigen 6 family member M6 [Puntigrus tetrazona]
MDLQISVLFLAVLFTAGHSFRCYHCNGTTSDCEQTTCSEYPSCFSATYFDGNITVFKSCFLSNGCPSGSINFGTTKLSLYCCDTDLCNAQNVSEPSNNTSNGMACYYCDGQSCSNTMSCSGTEDRCFYITETYALKGCVSKSMCTTTTFLSLISNITCCEGNLCNGDNITQSTTQSFSFVQSTTQSFSSAQSTTQSFSSVQSTTQSSTSMQSSTQSTTKIWRSTTANGANSVSQSFLFLFCSLLSFILLH